MSNLIRQGDANLAAFGQFGSSVTNGPAPLKPPTGMVFVAITMLTDCTFNGAGSLVSEDANKFFNSELTANNEAEGSETPLAGSGGEKTGTIVFPKGVTIYGRWTEIDQSGSLVAYIGH